MWPLQAVIGNGTKGTIYKHPVLLFVRPDNSTCPVCPLFLFPTSSPERADAASSPPGPLIFRGEASGKRAPSPLLSIAFNHPSDVYSALRPFFLRHPSSSPSSLLPSRLLPLGIASHRRPVRIFPFLSVSLSQLLFPPPPHHQLASRRLFPLAFPLCLKSVLVPFVLSEAAEANTLSRLLCASIIEGTVEACPGAVGGDYQEELQS